MSVCVRLRGAAGRAPPVEECSCLSLEKGLGQEAVM